MCQPIYFLPNLRKAAADSVPMRRSVLQERGLAEIFADVPLEQQPLFELPGRGPGDKAGCLLCYQTTKGEIPRRWGYYPAEQQWTPVGDGSQVWIGVDTAEPPTPEEMQRRRTYPGYVVDMAEGARWTVPVIRRPDGSTELPTDMVWDASGNLVEPIKPAYVAYWEETAETARWAFEKAELSKARALELAVRALSLNYRFGKAEQNVLRLIDGTNYATVLLATVDYLAAKKNSPEASSLPGSQETTPATDPQEAIST